MQLIEQIIEGIKTPDERTEKGLAGKIGPSDLSGCSRRVKYTMEQWEQQESKYWLPAPMGTAFHNLLAEVAEKHIEGALVEQRVTITLGKYTIEGTADLIDTKGSTVVDHKTTSNLDWVKKHGPDPKHVKQVHLYALGAVQAGLLSKNTIVTGCLVYWDRSGTDQEPYVAEFDILPSILADLSDKLAYIIEHPLDEIPQEEALPTCLNLCPFAHHCRLDFFESKSVSDDPDVYELLEEFQRVKVEMKALEQEKRDIEQKIANIPDGRCGDFSIKWINVSQSVIPEYTRKGYSYPRITKAKVKK